MKAVVITRPGGPEVLEIRDVPGPEPSHSEVLVAVKAVGLNQADIIQRMGRYPAPPDVPADIPGLEYSGVITKIGRDVRGLKEGDKVFGLVGGGSYAEQLIVHHRALAHMPEGMSFTDAAAIPEAFITAYDAMVSQGGLTAGETVLINAFGSGVGTAAIQIVKALNAAAIGTSRTASKSEAGKRLGLDHVITVSEGRFAEQVLDITDKRGVDLVLELAGGPYLKEDLKCVAMRARILVVGLLGGASTEIDFGLVLHKRLQLRGTSLRMRPLEEKIGCLQSFEKHLVPLFVRKILKPVVDRVMPFKSVQEAHAYLQGHTTFGKVVLSLE